MKFFKDSLGFKNEDIMVIERTEFVKEKNPLEGSKRGTMIKNDDAQAFGWLKSEETQKMLDESAMRMFTDKEIGLAN